MKYLISDVIETDLKHFLTEHRDCPLLLIGGTGLIGRWIVELLSTVNTDFAIDVMITGRTRPRWLQQGCHGSLNVKFLELDLSRTEFRAVTRQLPQQIGVCMSLAAPRARETFSGLSGLEKFKLSVNSASLLFELCEKVKLQALVTTSSGVASASSGESHEKYDIAPQLFGEHESLANGKRVIERATWEIGEHAGVNSAIARIFSCYGPHIPTNIHYAIGNFIGAANADKDIIVQGTGQPIRDFCYASDLIAMLCNLMTKLLSNSQTNFLPINLGTDQRHSILDAADCVALCKYGNTARVKIIGQPQQSIGNRNRDIYAPDVALAKETHIFRHTVTLEQGVSSLIKV